jgi:hypothetical protein
MAPRNIGRGSGVRTRWTAPAITATCASAKRSGVSLVTVTSAFSSIVVRRASSQAT